MAGIFAEGSSCGCSDEVADSLEVGGGGGGGGIGVEEYFDKAFSSFLLSSVALLRRLKDSNWWMLRLQLLKK